MTNKKDNEVEASATSVSVTLNKGVISVKSSRINLLTGVAEVHVQNTGTYGHIQVEIVDPSYIDEAVKSWEIGPGEKLDKVVSVPKATYYLRLTDPFRYASGKGTLGLPLYA